MTISMYQASIPPFLHGFSNLSAILKKAEDYAAEKKIDPGVLIQSRLYPDMLPLVKQVQIASDVTKGAAARLAGIDVPRFEDKETTFAELHQRIEKTVSFLKTITPQQIDGSESREIKLKVGGKDMTFDGLKYLLYFAIPNFYFHITTTYAILRHNGLEIGKVDFLGSR